MTKFPFNQTRLTLEPETTEILILVQSFHNDLKTAVKLKLEDGESCLWQIRGYDQAVLSELKHLFNEED